jgi:hypothetical protein
VKDLAKLLRDDVEYRVRLYSYCIAKCTDNYRAWLVDDYMRRLEAEAQHASIAWRCSARKDRRAYCPKT